MSKPSHGAIGLEDAKSIFQGFRSEAGEDLVLKKNLFIEGVLPGAIIRNLSDKEMDVYRKPFLKEFERQDVDCRGKYRLIINQKKFVILLKDYSLWMSINEIPKLFINANPGSILKGKQREFCRKWKNQEEVTVKGSHFIQEDSPDDIGQSNIKLVSKNLNYRYGI